MAEKDDGFVRWRCKACGQRLKVKKTWEGGDVMPCPKCGEMVNVPLSNLEAIAKGTEMAETGDPGRLRIDPELLRKRLGSEQEKAAGPGSVGGAPTIRREGWSAEAAFGRIQELDQLAAGVAKADQDVMGQIQRVYRSGDLSKEERHEQIKDAALQRRQEVQELVNNRLTALRQQINALEGQQQRLGRGELDHLARLKRAAEAITFYSHYVLGLKA